MASSAKRFANSRIENYMHRELGAEDGSGKLLDAEAHGTSVCFSLHINLTNSPNRCERVDN